MEEACTELDLKLAEVKQGEGGIGGTTFVQYSVVLKQWSSLKAQQESQDAYATLLEQLTAYLSLSLPNAETNTILLAAKNEAALARRRAQRNGKLM